MLVEHNQVHQRHKIPEAGLEPASKNTGRNDISKVGGPHSGPFDAGFDEKLLQFVTALKARGFTPTQIRDITAAAAESGLVELERSQASR